MNTHRANAEPLITQEIQTLNSNQTSKQKLPVAMVPELNFKRLGFPPQHSNPRNDSIRQSQ